MKIPGIGRYPMGPTKMLNPSIIQSAVRDNNIIYHNYIIIIIL